MMTKARSAIAMPKLGLGREIAIVLLIKLAVIWLAAVFVFGPITARRSMLPRSRHI